MDTLTRIVQVCVLHTYNYAFDYQADAAMSLCIGGRVCVPFKNKLRIGIVVHEHFDIPKRALKSIARVIDNVAVVPEDLLRLCLWMSKYYHAPLSEIIPLALPKLYRLGNAATLPTTTYYQLTNPANAHAKITKRALKLHALIDEMASGNMYTKSMLWDAGFKTAALQALIQENLVSQHELPVLPHVPTGTPELPLLLHSEQAAAVNEVLAYKTGYRCFFLQGVTGSGKTEVYLQIIAQLLSANKQVLILVPEIGLTPQLLSRFRQRFHVPMVVIHSHLNDRERQTAFQWASQGAVQLVIGTRSAVFTPLPHLAMIIIDEEHDASFKQMEGVRYSARDTALMRAHNAQIPIILGSATPSLESLHNCLTHKYVRLRLTHQAMTQTPLHYQILDIRNQKLHEGLAAATITLIEKHLQQQNQVLVFINRRGFAPVLLCHACGWMADCKACDAHLTMHREKHKLVCHHCGNVQPIILKCKSCASTELIPLGVGTQRIHAFLEKRFQNTQVLRLDRDTLQKKHSLDAALNKINTGEVQLIIGTQLLAKGHHFPRLTLVVVLDADNGFYNHDFRALERLGQLFTQVAGRAGRANYPGEVIIQTHLPTHPMLNRLIQDGYEPFAVDLLAAREQAALPPYHYMAILRAQSNQVDRIMNFLSNVKTSLKTMKIEVYGPAPAPLARKANQHRMQLLLKSSTRKALNTALGEIHRMAANNSLGKGIQWVLDVDPIDLS